MVHRAGRLAELREEWRLAAARRDIFAGDRNDDVLNGTDLDDTISGFAGNDTLSGNGGADDISGGAGDDEISGGTGDDVLYGRDGWDLLMGGRGDDVLDGGGGRDTLQGGIGADTIVGGAGHDLLIGAADEDRDVYVFGTDDGKDRIRGFDAWTDVIQLGEDAPYLVSVDTATGTATLTYGDTVVRIADVFDQPLLIDTVAVNDAPVIEALDAGAVSEDVGPVSHSLLDRQRDPEGDLLHVEGAEVQLFDSNGVEITSASPLYADVSDVVVGDDVLLYPQVLNHLAFGTTVTLVVGYSVSDGETSTLNRFEIDITGENDDPTFGDGTLDATAYGGIASFDLSTISHDGDVGDTLTYAIDPAWIGAGATVVGSMLVIDPSVIAGDIPRDGEGNYSVDLIATDSQGAVATGSVSGVIIAPNRVPVAGDDTLAVDSDDSYTFSALDLLANDSDADGDMLFGGLWDDVNLQGVLFDNGDGTFTYDPVGAFDDLAPGETAVDTFTYYIEDGFGGFDTAEVDITVTGADASAGWYGQQMYYETIVFGDVSHSTTVNIGPGVENAFHPEVTHVTVDLQPRQIVISSSIATDFTDVVLRYRDLSGLVDDFDDASVNFAQTTATGVDGDIVAVSGDVIEIDMLGISFEQNTQLVIDLDFV